VKPGNFGSSKSKGKQGRGCAQVGTELGTGNNRRSSESSMLKLVGNGGFNGDAERYWKCVRKLAKEAAR